MKTFLEIFESTKKDNPKQVKVKVKDKIEALEKLPVEESAFSGLEYTKRLHYCRHDEGQVPCSVEEL